MLQELLPGTVRVLGPGHPDTLAGRVDVDLASGQREVGTTRRRGARCWRRARLRGSARSWH